ncbi:AlpA family phage regulatory protein [Bradyrhizobium sp. KB893862 SZCCT0404]|uniref:helix-turn-helix transcriptional regulator n=1 Tax=Bradyrhizobium sp. KB893862 SZCCT0404 TaxID=2807672 RepID=UPI001BACDD47|nr:AlpA family phage regulatory protein [Bradyrhizobium sp. KB893862 SZCCT0404]MBR1172981.1 AlpA family phage regulatory protein [Bradyrhizobium sp. KB893862 SZCCT0404]
MSTRKTHRRRSTAATRRRNSADGQNPRRMLTEKQVLEIVPVSPATLWRMERDGLFPKGTFISANRKVWFTDEVVGWQNGVSGRRRGKHHYPKVEV